MALRFKIIGVTTLGTPKIDGNTTYQKVAITSAIIENPYPHTFQQYDEVNIEINSSLSITDYWTELTAKATAWVVANYPDIL
jgi:hypothetical protein